MKMKDEHITSLAEVKIFTDAKITVRNWSQYCSHEADLWTRARGGVVQRPYDSGSWLLAVIVRITATDDRQQN